MRKKTDVHWEYDRVPWIKVIRTVDMEVKIMYCERFANTNNEEMIDLQKIGLNKLILAPNIKLFR